MKNRLIATLTALSLTAVAGATAQAAEPVLAWQEPGYVGEAVIVTARRPASFAAGAEIVYADPTAESDQTLARKEPGYVMEVVIASASRSEVLAEAREAMLEAARARMEIALTPGALTGSPVR